MHWQMLSTTSSGYPSNPQASPAQASGSNPVLSPVCMPLATAAAVASTTMHFTPATALVGGLTLGVAAVAKYAITGRILGISGALKGFVQGNITPWRVWFTAGMVGGALVAQSITPAAFDILPPTFTVSSCSHSSFAPGWASASRSDTAGMRQQ